MGLSKKQIEMNLERAVRYFVSRDMDMIPGVLFENLLKHADGDVDSVLRLVGSDRRECDHCGEEIDKGACEENEDGENTCTCESCGHSHVWEDLPLAGPRYGGFPGAHSTVFWTDNARAAELAPECGFLVYESDDFNGHILAIDGGGYDFYSAHWTPLYLALGLDWHKRPMRLW